MNNELPAGSTLSHYRIVSKIGEGGMGEVYLAEDTKLDRKVAIKFLHEEFSKDVDKLGRFIQEAKAASALNHPNILTVYEIGEVDGKNYIATELIDGQTLREQLSHKKPFQLNQILKIGVQVSEALSAAHQAGIIHRDIKPENIMLRKDGYAKVLDFGLAKLSERRGAGEIRGQGDGGTRGHADAGTEGHGDGATGSDGESNTLIAASPGLPIPASPRPPVPASVNTTPGMVMGTVSYMSPEQARGKETDARTDIWSLGVVLYEMLSGKVPFSGETINHTIVSILEKEPLLLENVPLELQRIVRKSLTKDVEMRYQSARDLLIDLKNLRRELDIQGELERSVIPNRETQAQTSGESETQFFTGSGKRTASGQMAATQNVTTSSSSLEYAVTQAKSHKLATAVIGVLLVAALAAVGYLWFFSGGGGTQISSIAVLPFQNIGGNADSEYLSDGLAESLIYRLSQIPDLKVSPRSSVFRYKGQNPDAEKVGSELGVDAVMSGRLVQRGDNLTISVDLVDVRNKKTLWGEQYERKISDLLSTQREITAAIAEKLQVRLSGSGQTEITKRYTDNSEAYQHYLKGRHYWNKRTKDAIEQGIDHFQKAIDLDPKFALAYVGIADCYFVMPSYAYLSPKEAMPKAIAAAKRALEIDPELAEAHSSYGSVLTFEHRWRESEAALKRSLELNPNIAESHYRYSLEYLAPTGRLDEAISAIKRALELEPLSMPIGANLAGLYLYSRRNEAALEQALKVNALDPGHVTVSYWLGWAYVANGKYPEAIELCEKVLISDPENQDLLQIKGFAHAKAGRPEETRRVIAKFVEMEKRKYVVPYRVATLYAVLGEKDKAFVELEKSFEARDWDLTRLKIDPFVDSLRNDPRFRKLLDQLNLPG